MATQRTANDVAEMESDNTLLRSDNENLRSQVAVLAQENMILRADLAAARNEAREEMTRAIQIETIMSQVSMGLVSGLAKMKEQRRLARETLRLQQERELGVGDGSGPSFVQRPAMADGGFVQPREQRGGTLIAEAGGQGSRRTSPDPLRQPIERLRGDRPSGEPIDHPLLPKVDARSDDDDLRDLHADLGREQR